MPWLIQMAYFALIFLGIAVALWVSFWFLLVVFILGLLMVLWSHLRAFLLAKGILSPRFQTSQSNEETGLEEEGEATLTIIEGDYKRVDSE